MRRFLPKSNTSFRNQTPNFFSDRRRSTLLRNTLNDSIGLVKNIGDDPVTSEECDNVGNNQINTTAFASLPYPDPTTCFNEHSDSAESFDGFDNNSGVINNDITCVQTETCALTPEDRRENLSDSERDMILRHCQVCTKRVFNWSRLLSFCSISGPVHFTARQYAILATAIATASKNTISLATYKTIRTTQWDFMKKHLFVKTRTMYIKGNTRRFHRLFSVRKVITENNGNQDPRDCVRIILPSEWAKLDIITLPLYKKLFEPTLATSADVTIEKAPLIYDGDRSLYLSGTRAFWAFYDDSVLPAVFGEPLQYIVNKLQCFNSAFSVDSPIIEEVDGRSYLNCTLGGTWCVRSRRSLSQTKDLSVITRNLSDDELLLFCYTYFASHTLMDFEGINSSAIANLTQSEDSSEEEGIIRPTKDTELFTYPGDVCATLRVCSDSSPTSLCLFIGSHIWREEGRLGERISWIDTHTLRRSFLQYINNYILEMSTNNTILQSTRELHKYIRVPDNLSKVFTSLANHPLRIDLIAIASVPQLPLFGRDYIPTYARRSMRDCTELTNNGFLPDGTPYLIYRFILYTDGFKQKKSLSDKRSVNGCYMLPVGLPNHAKNSCLSVRTLSLGGYGQDTNEIMQHLINDIVDGVTTGFSATDASGRKVRLFHDPVGSFGDFPALTSQGDLSGHTADAHCSFCGTRKRKGTKCPPICSSIQRHSRRPSLVRFDERMSNIREEGVSESVRKHLGTACASEEEASTRFSISLANALVNREVVCTTNFSATPYSTNNHQVTKGFHFDSYLSAHVAPDHMFKGLISNVLTVCFHTITNSERTLFDKKLCAEISQHNLPTIDTVLNRDKHGKYKGLNNLSTSALFSTLLFAAQVFKLHGDRTKKKTHPFFLPHKLQEIISLSYWWPKISTYNQKDLNYVIGKPGEKPLRYWGDIQNLCDRYILSIQDYYEAEGQYASILDKPNAHRLLEFAYNTLPTFGHTLNVVELVLEQAHRMFKDWLEKNTNHDAHLSAVDIAIAKDWMARAFASYTLWQNGNENERQSAELSLMRLFLGEDAMYMDRNHSDVKEFFDSFFKDLPNVFQSPVLEEMRGTSSNSILEVVEERWVLMGRHDIKYRELLLQSVPNITANDLSQSSASATPSFFSTATFQRKEQYNKFSSTSLHNSLKVGSVIAVKTASLDTLNIVPDRNGTKTAFFAVYGFAFANNKDFAFARRFIRLKNTLQFQLDHVSALQSVLLNSSLKRVACVSPNLKTFGTEETSRLLLEEPSTTWTILDSSMGFPPRLG